MWKIKGDITKFRLELCIIVITIIASLSVPHIYTKIQHNNGTLLKVVEAYEVVPTAQGGFVKEFLVQDHEGNTHNVYSGFVAQWNKSEGSYINQKYLKSGGIN